LKVATNPSPELFAVAERCASIARQKGASEVAARAYKVRDVSVQWRDGQLEQINEATTRGVGLQLYVDGRYASVTSSDLRPEALDAFIGDSVAMTRTLSVDPFRSLPDPVLYEGQADVDLQLEDPAHSTVTPEQRRRLAQDLEEAARSVKGASAILSVTTGFSDSRSESVRVHSNGFKGGRVDTSFWTSAQVSVKDEDGRRPEDWSAAGVRFLSELPPAAEVGMEAASRALSRLGARKPESAVLPMVLENRAAGRLVGYLAGPLAAQSLQQKRSYLEGRLGETIGSDKLTLIDDPHLVKGFGSRLYDGEGLAARQLAVFEGGILRNYFVDTYYGKKLQIAPTTGGASNLTFALGTRSQAQLVAEIEDGILVTGFLGGNSNGTTGDFSLGVQGFRIRGGRVAEPVSELNISGNHLDLWKRLSAVGSDPYLYSSLRTPTLVFDGVQFAGL
jgi:PmbA protein